jgi:predicted glycosyltransferase
MERTLGISMKGRTHRALLFVHDGTSLGHLRRISRIAEALQGPFACLIVTGMREAHRIVPRTCELLTLPSWNGLIKERALRAGRVPWWNEPKDISRRLRSDLIQSVVTTFDPDLIIVDYLPYGQYGELENVLAASQAIKYFLLRGIVDASDLQLLGGFSTDAIASTFDRIVLAIDDKVLDVGRTYQFTPSAQAKCTYVGYVAPLSSNSSVVRKRYRVTSDLQWVVCSAGGGRNAELFALECIGLSRRFPTARFDVVIGPMSTLDRHELLDIPGNCTLHAYCDDLAEMNAAADVIVCGGGYNTLCEAIKGGAHIVIHPNQGADCDEQRMHAALLNHHYPIEFAPDIEGIVDGLRAALTRALEHGRQTHRLKMTGAQELACIANVDVQGAQDWEKP